MNVSRRFTFVRRNRDFQVDIDLEATDYFIVLGFNNLYNFVMLAFTSITCF